MRKLFALFLFLPTAAFADIKQEFVTSAQITVDMPYVVTNKLIKRKQYNPICNYRRHYNFR